MKKILASAALAVSVIVSALGFVGMVSSATAMTLSADNFCATSQLTTSTACVGTVIDPINDQPDTYLADESFFGIDNWTRVQKSDEANNPLYNLFVLALTFDGEGKGLTGTWSVTGFNGWSNAVIVLKGGPTWSAYLLDVAFLTGTWNTLGLETGGGKSGPGLSHMSLYVGGIQSVDNNPVVPLPAALPLLLGGLGGLAWLGRFRRRSATTAA